MVASQAEYQNDREASENDIFKYLENKMKLAFQMFPDLQTLFECTVNFEELKNQKTTECKELITTEAIDQAFLVKG